jgi:hypothetical protein
MVNMKNVNKIIKTVIINNMNVITYKTLHMDMKPIVNNQEIY